MSELRAYSSIHAMIDSADEFTVGEGTTRSWPVEITVGDPTEAGARVVLDIDREAAESLYRQLGMVLCALTDADRELAAEIA